MKMDQWLSVALVSMTLTFGALALNGCTSQHPPGKSNKASQYICPMHPELVKDKPGDCPKCGMKLVEKK